MRLILLLFVATILMLSSCEDENECSQPISNHRYPGDTLFIGRWQWAFTVNKCILNESPPYVYGYDTIRVDDTRPFWLTEGHPQLTFKLDTLTYNDNDGVTWCLRTWNAGGNTVDGVTAMNILYGGFGNGVFIEEGANDIVRVDYSGPMDTIVVSPPFKEYPDPKCHTLDIYTRIN